MITYINHLTWLKYWHVLKCNYAIATDYTSRPEGQSLTVGPLNIDFEQRCVKVNGQEVDLTYTEYELLSLLARNRGRIVTYDILLSEVWGYDEVSELQSVHTYINRLRKKIETPANRRFIRNEPKIGYRFVGEGVKGVTFLSPSSTLLIM